MRLPRLRPWMIVSAAWIVPAVFAVINRIAQARLQRWEPATLRELLFEFGDWLLYAFLTPTPLSRNTVAHDESSIRRAIKLPSDQLRLDKISH